MEFWKCLNDGKGIFLPEDLELQGNKVSEQEPETLYDTPNCPFVSSQESLQFGFPDSLRKLREVNCSDPRKDVFGNQNGFDCYTDGSRMPGLLLGSDFLDLKRVDLKLGGLDDGMGESSKRAASMHTSMQPVPTKKSRLINSYSQRSVCQVQGCNKDLSSYKDYYKRHKVCDAHTKTASVIVKGIEQRFCQQCSRFHLLAEFDDGKRSCRKRLANHNERRRKSPGTRFLRSSSRTSFIFQEMLPTKPEPGKWFSHMKYEDSTLDSDSLLSFHDIDKSSGIAVPNFQDFSRIPDSSRALSLLSAQSLKASNQPLNHYNFSAIGADFKVPDDSVLIGSNSNASNNKYSLSSGQGSVVDLLQLSSHLQMVEHKRNLMH